jgi:hypothetical protein
MRVEEQPRPVGRRDGSRDEVGDRLGVFGDDRLLLHRERGLGLGVVTSLDDDSEPPLRDPRLHLHRYVERDAAELLKPEAMLLDEVECEPVAAGWSRRDDLGFELDRLTGRHRAREGRANAVPDDRVSEGVEPMVRDLQSEVVLGTPGR